MTALLAPLRYQFFLHGLAAAVLVGAICGAMGVYVVLRRMSYIGHGLSHSVFGGAVLSYMLHWDFYLGAGLSGFAAALLINALSQRRRATTDSAIGTVSTAGLALGIAAISRLRRFTVNIQAALFGNILGVTGEDLLVLLGVTLCVALIVFFAYKQLLFVTFDPAVASVYGIRTRSIDTLFALTLALVVVAALQILGETLVAAVLIIPAAAARLLTESFSRMLWIAVGIGVVAAVAGMYISYYTDIASGASITITATCLYAAAYAVYALRPLLRGKVASAA